MTGRTPPRKTGTKVRRLNTSIERRVTRNMPVHPGETVDEAARKKLEAHQAEMDQIEIMRLRQELQKADRDRAELTRLRDEARQYQIDQEDLARLREVAGRSQKNQDELMRLKQAATQAEQEHAELMRLRQEAQRADRDRVEIARLKETARQHEREKAELDRMRADLLRKDQGLSELINLQSPQPTETRGASVHSETTANRQIDDLQKEIERLRLAQRADANRNVNNGNETEAAGIFMNGLMNQMQHFNIDIRIPAFHDEETNHPVEFLEDVEKYFEIKRVPETQKVIVAETAMKGRAKVWVDAHRGVFRTYQQFKESFLAEFFSIPIQVRAKNKWATKRYRHPEGAMQTYFLKQVREARHFSPALSEYEINYTIMSQLPVRARDALLLFEGQSTKKIAQALGQLDAGKEERDRDWKKYNSNSTPQTAAVKNIQFADQMDHDQYYYDESRAYHQSSQGKSGRRENENWRQRPSGQPQQQQAKGKSTNERMSNGSSDEVLEEPGTLGRESTGHPLTTHDHSLN